LSFSKLSRKQKIIFLLEYVRVREVLDIGKKDKIEGRIRLVVTMSDEDIIMRFKDFF
jgi:hypothetical protein